MRKSLQIIASFVAILATIPAHSQHYYYDNKYYDKDVIWELGTSVGIMRGITDVGGRSSQVNSSFYFGGLYQNVIGARFEATWGRIAGADSNGVEKKRNLSFRTPIREMAVIAEFHPMMLQYREDVSRFSPYIAAGLGWFTFNPQANLNGNWVDLQPLRTEGQGFPQTASYQKETTPYHLSQAALIAGAGVKFEASQFVTVRAEFLFRKTYTDYLDDVSGYYVDPSWFDSNLSPQAAILAKELYDRSVTKDPALSGPGMQRGVPESKDHYFTFNIKLGINLGRQKVER